MGLINLGEEIIKLRAERDTLIDDIAVLKANISRLERENEKLKREKEELEKGERD